MYFFAECIKEHPVKISSKSDENCKRNVAYLFLKCYFEKNA